MKTMRPTFLLALVALSLAGAAHAQSKPEIVLTAEGKFAGPALLLKETGDKDLPDTLARTKDGVLEIRSVSLGAQADSSFLKGSGAAVGKPVPSQVVIQRSSDKASLIFWKKLATGTSFPKLVIRLASGIVMTLENVFVTDLKINSDEQTSENISLVYKKIKLEVFSLDKATGRTPAILEWDITTMSFK